jgi:hypothetical protein
LAGVLDELMRRWGFGGHGLGAFRFGSSFRVGGPAVDFRGGIVPLGTLFCRDDAICGPVRGWGGVAVWLFGRGASYNWLMCFGLRAGFDHPRLSGVRHVYDSSSHVYENFDWGRGGGGDSGAGEGGGGE